MKFKFLVIFSCFYLGKISIIIMYKESFLIIFVVVVFGNFVSNIRDGSYIG